MSKISFNCPHCDQPFRTDASRAGSEGTCPKCAGRIVVPQDGPVAKPEPMYMEPETIGSCPLCSRDMFRTEQILECISCGTSHHLECWNKHQGCTNHNCTMAPPDPERSSRPRVGGGMPLQPAMAMAGGVSVATVPPRVGTPAKTRAEGALASLIFGILGLFICGFAFGWVAISAANKANKQIAADPERYSGSGLAAAGMVMGVIDILAWAVLVFTRVGG